MLSAGNGLKAQEPFAYNEISFVPYETGYGARAIGLSGAFVGVADDYSALYWNPAGLGQVKSNQFYVSMSHNMRDIGTGFLGNSMNNDQSKTTIGSLGLLYSVDVHRGSLVFAGGYNRINNYNSLFGYSGFNATDSYIRILFDEPFIPDRVGQEESIEVNGGLSQYSFGVSFEAAERVYVGASLNYWTGDRDFYQLYLETDDQNLWTEFPNDFDQYHQENSYNKDISGLDLKIGILYRLNNFVRIGAVLNTPRSIDFEEDWTYNEDIFFDEGSDDLADFDDAGVIDYEIKLPFMFDFGVSYERKNLLVSAGVQLADWSQMKYEGESPFSDADTPELNRNLSQTLESTMNPRIGVEYSIPEAGLKLRGGYSIIRNPLKDALDDSDRKVLTGGFGFKLSPQATFDIAYRRATWKTQSISDYNLIAVPEDHTDSRVFAGVNFSF